MGKSRREYVNYGTAGAEAAASGVVYRPRTVSEARHESSRDQRQLHHGEATPERHGAGR